MDGSDEPYAQFPGAKKHHLYPHSRGGPDHEFNLFPWNEKCHAFWHKIFDVMSVREVYAVLDDAWLLIFQTRQDFIVPEWRAVLALRGQLGGPMKPVCVTSLRSWWHRCFGSTSLTDAHRLVRYMMLFMVFGRHGDRSNKVFISSYLRRFLDAFPSTGDRAWAFRTCFRGLPHAVTLRHVKKVISRTRANVKAIPIH